ncbi:protein CMS1 [Kwoniella heveanensis CBS 569]|uniref:Protein CMS1 n=1 Tax=Kwoniella heveanensis BCC8398 TaxID=1296120 RepID=A0A1B9GZ28_9TREE|nr:protein CMS1 [Kwoniella heveanensis BCC8398]OCF44121.1 protein CMS1 [Kwoniella heveanensis CBS 569]
MAQTIAKEPTPMKTGGDDLDDGLELDPDLLAASDDEEEVSDNDQGGDDVALSGGEGSKSKSSRNGKLPVLEGEEDEILASPIAEGKKRKAEEVDEEDGDEREEVRPGQVNSGAVDGDDESEARKAEKKRRKKEKEKERKARKLQKATDPSDSNVPPTHLPPADISSILLRSIRESYPSASSVELDDIIIPTTNILSPPDYTPPKEEQVLNSTTDSAAKTTPSFVGLQKRVEDLLKVTEKKKLHVATPRVIILSLSGLRCADVVRGVRDVKGQGDVAKLFAKHFKLADQIKYLEKTKVSIAVGTPARVGKLLNEGAINITSDTVLLLDISHQDSKTRTILTLPEVRDELWKTVFSGKARETLLKGGVRIGVF